MRVLSRSANETRAIGMALGACLRAGDTVLLFGDLGAGKSVFARGCAAAQGVKREMASPTFTLMQPYDGDETRIYHFDLYRLSDPDELYFSGLEEHIGADGIALIEWPEKGEVLPGRCVKVRIGRASEDDARLIDIDLVGMDERAQRVAEALKPFEAN